MTTKNKAPAATEAESKTLNANHNTFADEKTFATLCAGNRLEVLV